MYSIKKWFASKISNSSNDDDLNDEYNEPGRSNAFNYSSSLAQSSSGQQLPFNVSNGAKTILQFYYSDDELNMIASELESFDGRRDPLRCTELVSQLRIAQDKVMQLLFQLMDEWNCNRAPRDYRLKFPEDLLNDSENGESFNGQIWFSAECLASGSDIMNHEQESDMLRPLAKLLTNNLDQLRIMLRQSSNEISNKIKFYQDLIQRMEQFDRMFSAFEFEYVKAMLPIKSVDDIEKQQELTVLFSEALGCTALKRNLIAQIDVDEFNPSVMIALPRLAIVHGLTRCGNDNPLFRRHKHNLSNMFKSYHSSLHRIQAMLKSLRPVEIFMLEKLLSNEENLNDCVDSMFEEPNSFKQENEFNHQEEYSKQKEKLKIKENQEIQNSIDNKIKINRLIKSKSLPNLINFNELNELKKDFINKTTDDQLLFNNEDEIDATVFKALTKRIKRCVSQLLIKKHYHNSNLTFENNYHDDNFNQFSSNNQFNCNNNTLYNSDYYQSHQEEESSNNYLNTSQQSTNADSSSSEDSYEINLASNAKESNYISDVARELLHKLFVSISGIADQLQSNFASDLRQILKLVFILHTSSIDEADNGSLEEAEEALELNNYTSSTKTSNFEEMLNNSENLQLLFGTTLNAIENAQTNSVNNNLPREETVDDEFDYHHQNEYNDTNVVELDNIYENYPIHDYQNHQSSLNQSINQQTSNDLTARLKPLWAPDESTHECIKCKIQFTLLRRRHHCRACGQVFCNSCSSHFICLVQFGYTKPVRVCDRCYNFNSINQ